MTAQTEQTLLRYQFFTGERIKRERLVRREQRKRYERDYPTGTRDNLIIEKGEGKTK